MIKDIGSGNFGVAKLVRDVWTKELYAVKFIERGEKVSAPSFFFFYLKVMFLFEILLKDQILESGLWLLFALGWVFVDLLFFFFF